MSNTQGVFLTVKEVARRYRISKATVYNLIRAGKLPAGIHLGQAHRWSLSELEAFEGKKGAAYV